MPSEYLNYVQDLQQLATNLDWKRRERLGTRESASWRPAQRETAYKAKTPPPPADVMDWELTKASKAIQRQNRELAGKRAKWVGKDEIQRRQKEGLCVKCGRKGCWSDRCPLLPAKHLDANARAKKSRPKLPTVQNMVESDSDTSDTSD